MNPRKVNQLLFVSISFTLLIIIGISAYKAWRIYSVVDALQEDKKQATELLSAENLSHIDPLTAGELTRKFTQDMTKLRDEVRFMRFAPPLLGWMPNSEATIDNILPLLTMADSAVVIGETVEPFVGSILTILQEAEQQDDTIPQLLQLIIEFQPQLNAIIPEIQQLSTSLETVDRSMLPARVLPYIELFDEYLPVVEQSLPLVNHLPEIMGTYEQQRILIITQAQSTITGFGIVSLNHGQVETFNYFNAPSSTKDSVDLASAESIIDFYEQNVDQTSNINSAIVLNQAFVQQLPNLVGTVNFEGLGAVDSGQLQSYLQQANQQLEAGQVSAEWWTNNETLMRGLLQATINKIVSDPKNLNIQQLAQIIVTASNQQQVQIWSEQVEINADLDKTGWGSQTKQVNP